MTISVHLEGLIPGPHGTHIHEYGDISEGIRAYNVLRIFPYLVAYGDICILVRYVTHILVYRL